MSALPPTPASADDGPVYVVDRLVVRAGEVAEVVRRIDRDYRPGATARGMTLTRLLVGPPVWDAAREHTVTAVWRLDTVAAWWEMTRRGRPDIALHEFWRALDPLLVTRTRDTAIEPVGAVCRDGGADV